MVVVTPIERRVGQEIDTESQKPRNQSAISHTLANQTFSLVHDVSNTTTLSHPIVRDPSQPHPGYAKCELFRECQWLELLALILPFSATYDLWTAC